ncbi:MAG: hypothetical protein ACKOHK_03950 [Planctomycetia bacterium]
MLSSLFIIAVVIIAAIPTHLTIVARVLAGGGPPPAGFMGWLSGPQGAAASLLAISVLGVVATFLPLELGLRHFRRLEP